MKGSRRLRRSGPGMGAAVTVKGSHHDGGDDGVPVEAAATGSRRWQCAL
jgi:hypothetical protein